MPLCQRPLPILRASKLDSVQDYFSDSFYKTLLSFTKFLRARSNSASLATHQHKYKRSTKFSNTLRSHLEHAAASHQCVCRSPLRCCFSYFWLWKHTHTSALSEHDAR